MRHVLHAARDDQVLRCRTARACAAKCTACWEEPHCRSMVTPGTSSGSPAASQHVRAMSPACGPTVSTQPKTTSSTAAGSTPSGPSVPSARARRGRRGARRRARRCACRPGCGPRRRCRPRPWRGYLLRVVLVAGVSSPGSLRGPWRGTAWRSRRRDMRAARLVPAGGDPDGVADEAVDERPVEVGAEDAVAHAAFQQRQPDLFERALGVGEVAEALAGRGEVRGLLLVDGDGVPVRSIAAERLGDEGLQGLAGRRDRRPARGRSRPTCRPGRWTGSRPPSTPWSRSGSRGCRRGCRRRRPPRGRWWRRSPGRRRPRRPWRAVRRGGPRGALAVPSASRRRGLIGHGRSMPGLRGAGWTRRRPRPVMYEE